jgi:hypothetical protein
VDKATMATLLFCNRLCAELDQVPQDTGAALSGIHRSCSVDRRSEIVGLGQEVALTGGRHPRSVSL